MVYKKNSGFTIIELLIAISVFSLAIVLIMSGTIQLGRLYKQGATKARLSTISREIHAQFAQDLQYSKEYNTYTNVATNENYICLGTSRYRVVTNLSLSNYGELNLDTISGPSACSTATASKTQKLLSPTGPNNNNSRATNFDFTIPPNSTSPYVLYTRFVTGEKDLFNNNFSNRCTSSFGKEYCVVIELKSVLARKVKN
jgi:prepilin-type N-terminal cleavage/methylation domain-containing protein